MKVIVLILAMAFSMNSFAMDVSLSPSLSTALSVAGDDFKIAHAIMNESQDFYQTGELSLQLSDLVKKVIAENPETSTEEAVDSLVLAAEKILK